MASIAKINLSFLGLGVEIEGVSPITDINVAVTRINRLIKKGVITSPKYGHLDFTLPRFKEFVLREE